MKRSVFSDRVTRYVWTVGQTGGGGGGGGGGGRGNPFSKKNGYVWTGPKSFWIENQRHCHIKNDLFVFSRFFKPEPVKGLGIIWFL